MKSLDIYSSGDSYVLDSLPADAAVDLAPLLGDEGYYGQPLAVLAFHLRGSGLLLRGRPALFPHVLRLTLCPTGDTPLGQYKPTLYIEVLLPILEVEDCPTHHACIGVAKLTAGGSVIVVSVHRLAPVTLPLCVC